MWTSRGHALSGLHNRCTWRLVGRNARVDRIVRVDGGTSGERACERRSAPSTCVLGLRAENYRGDLKSVSAETRSISFSEILPGKKKQSQSLLFETEIAAKVWCEMLLSNAARILRGRGLAGYHAAWMGGDFPVGAYLRVLAYRKNQFRLGSAADDFLRSVTISLLHDLGVLRREAVSRSTSRGRPRGRSAGRAPARKR